MESGTVITIGTFDGVHRGHQEILGRVRARSEGLQLPSVAYVFETPPRAFLREGDPPRRRLLLPPSVRYKLIRRYVDRIVKACFSEIRLLSSEGFIADIVVGELRGKEIIVGEGFRFGKGREGDITTLRSLASAHGYRVEGVPPVIVDGKVVSSTLIRGLLSQGRIAEATRLLGRFPVLIGEVTSGDRLGRRLGYPTANLRISPEILLPGSGVYLARAFVAGGWADALLYIGTRPSVEDKDLRCELHLMREPARELYGLTIEVRILERLREDRAYPSLDDLRRQIGRDLRRARERLRHYPPFLERIDG